MNQKSKNKKNPLFVVTNNGQDVQEAEGLFDAMVKRFGLAPLIEFINTILQMISEQVGGAVALELARGFLDEVINILEKLLKIVDPVLAFGIIRR